MGKTLKEVIGELPTDRQKRIEARYRELKGEVESLRDLRKAAGKAQADVAAALHVKQPSISKLEKQADMYLSTLRGYIEAMGGQLDLVVRLPTKRTVRLKGLGDVGGGHSDIEPPRSSKRRARST